MLGRRRGSSILSHDAAVLRGASRWTRLAQLVLAAAALAALAAAAVLARGADPGDRSVLPAGTTGVVVLDLSQSIVDTDYARLGAALRHLVDANASVGLVAFSDSPYELLPPGTPARELRPLIARLRPSRGGQRPNPWTEAFRSGTRISAGLAVAREMIARDGVENPSILLISDLETAPEDLGAMLRTMRELRAASIPVRVVALSPTRESRRSVETVLGREAFAPAAVAEPAPERTDAAVVAAGVPLGLLGLGALFLAALAAHERLAARLALTGGRA